LDADAAKTASQDGTRRAALIKVFFYCDRLKIRQIASGGQGFALDPPGASRPWTVFTTCETPGVAKQQVGVWGRRAEHAEA
jgi:hypothetical protein